MQTRLLDWLVPPTCAACAAPVGHARAFCRACAATVLRADAGALAHAAFLYGGALATAIMRWKYEGALGVGTSLTRLFAAEIAHFVPPGAVLVPMPLHPRRLAERGFNPAFLLAQELGRATKAPVAWSAMRRVRDTPKQSRLGRAARAENVRGAFAAHASLEGALVMLVDDVCTTGATLRACEATARAAGAVQVSAAVLALAPPPTAPAQTHDS